MVKSKTASDAPAKKKSDTKKSPSKSPSKHVTGYILFSKEMRPQIPEEEKKTGMAWLGQQWRQLPDEEKAEWNERATQQNEASGATTPARGKKKKGKSDEAEDTAATELEMGEEAGTAAAGGEEAQE